MTKKHIHKYKRFNIAGFRKPPYLVFKCTLLGCTHYVPVKLAFGNVVLCNRCNDNMQMTTKNIEQALPHCEDCTKKKNKTVEKEDKLEALFRDLTKSIK